MHIIFGLPYSWIVLLLLIPAAGLKIRERRLSLRVQRFTKSFVRNIGMLWFCDTMHKCHCASWACYIYIYSWELRNGTSDLGWDVWMATSPIQIIGTGSHLEFFHDELRQKNHRQKEPRFATFSAGGRRCERCWKIAVVCSYISSLVAVLLRSWGLAFAKSSQMVIFPGAGGFLWWIASGRDCRTNHQSFCLQPIVQILDLGSFWLKIIFWFSAPRRANMKTRGHRGALRFVEDKIFEL